MAIFKKRSKPITALELHMQLMSDPEFQARRKIQIEQRQKYVALHKEALAALIRELKDEGMTYETLDELRESGICYAQYVPLLLKWLPQVSLTNAKSSIVRALSVPWGKPATRALIEEFQKPLDDKTSIRWTIGNALSVVADDSVFDEIVALARNTKFGKAREMVALSLRNMKNPKAVDVLLKLLDDDEVAGHAIMALGKLKAKKARNRIEDFLTHQKSWFRKEAKRAIAKIDRCAKSGKP